MSSPDVAGAPPHLAGCARHSSAHAGRLGAAEGWTSCALDRSEPSHRERAASSARRSSGAGCRRRSVTAHASSTLLSEGSCWRARLRISATESGRAAWPTTSSTAVRCWTSLAAALWCSSLIGGALRSGKRVGCRVEESRRAVATTTNVARAQQADATPCAKGTTSARMVVRTPRHGHPTPRDSASWRACRHSAVLPSVSSTTPASHRPVNSEHAHCHACRNLVRHDWLRCLHCGAPSPVARPLGRTLLHASLLAFATTVSTFGAVNGSAIWRYLNGEPARLVGEVMTATAAAAGGAAGPTPSARVPVQLPGPGGAARAARLASGLTPSVALATVPLATVAEPASPSAAGTARCVAAGRAERRLDDSTLRRTIAACTSIEALDSLESQLHAAFPSDPALRRGARAVQQLEARRAQLAVRAAATATRGADGGVAAAAVP